MRAGRAGEREKGSAKREREKRTRANERAGVYICRHAARRSCARFTPAQAHARQAEYLPADDSQMGTFLVAVGYFLDLFFGCHPSHSESFRVIPSRSESVRVVPSRSKLFGVILSYSELFGVIPSRYESFRVVPSSSELFGVISSNSELF